MDRIRFGVSSSLPPSLPFFLHCGESIGLCFYCWFFILIRNIEQIPPYPSVSGVQKADLWVQVLRAGLPRHAVQSLVPLNAGPVIVGSTHTHRLALASHDRRRNGHLLAVIPSVFFSWNFSFLKTKTKTLSLISHWVTLK